MKKKLIIACLLLSLVFAINPLHSQSTIQSLPINLYGDSICLPFDASLKVPYSSSLSDTGIQSFYTTLNEAQYEPLITFLLNYKEKYNLNDWLYYQLIRKTANAISPKAQNYHRYTLYKWFLLAKSGYDATVRIINDDRLLFYVRSDDNVYNIPFQISNGKQYVCLNYHDYDTIDLEKAKPFQKTIHVPGADKTFSYRITELPDFANSAFTEKDLHFSYQDQDYSFKVRLNPVVKDIFANYPVVDFESYFNIPLSKETYASLMPGLKEAIKKMDQKKGIDYLMHFTRYAFSFEKDTDNFGKEKRLAPEETLLYEHSDCEDRAALFFYLVKEIYNLPMITLLYPEHVTIAIQFPKPVGKIILYKGNKYTVCEPTPQAEDLKIGQLPHTLRKANYDVGYEYIPAK